MILHLFNSSSVSGPETLVLPNLAKLSANLTVLFLVETRLGARATTPVEFAKSLGLNTISVEVTSRLDLRAINKLARVLEKLSPKIVHAHDVKASTYALLASTLCERRDTKRWALISTHHGVRGRSGIKPRLYEALYASWILPKFDRVLTVCESDRGLLLKRRLPQAKLQTHLNGVDREYPERASALKIRSEWGVEADSILLGVVGRLAPEKGLFRVLEVIKFLVSSHPNLPKWEVVFVGEGKLRQQLEQRVVKLGLQSRVRFVGYRKEAAKEMVALDLLISLSPAEGLPIALVEAGAANVPVFATAVDGINDLIPSSEYGFAVDPRLSDRKISEKLAAVISNAQTRAACAKAFNRHALTHFSGSRWRSELLSIYQIFS